MEILQLQPLVIRGGARWGGFKKFKPIPSPARGMRVKSCPIPTPPPLRDRENLHRAKWGGVG